MKQSMSGVRAFSGSAYLSSSVTFDSLKHFETLTLIPGHFIVALKWV